jgi:hypothetical protein
LDFIVDWVWFGFEVRFGFEMILDIGLVFGKVIGVGALLGVVVLGMAKPGVGNVWFCSPGPGKVLGFTGKDWNGIGLWFVLGIVLEFVLGL